MLTAGPAVAVSVGYVDPGNWATDLAAGTYGVRLLWAISLANLMAILLQTAAATLARRTREDLGTAIARRWPQARKSLWAILQLATMATDLAEFAGVVVGIQLLTNLSRPFAVVTGIVVVAIVLRTGSRNLRRLEGTLAVLVAAIAAAYLYELNAIHPDLGAVLRGSVVPAIPDAPALWIVIGIIGATVMPHNLFLHSSLIASRAHDTTLARSDVLATVAALCIAALINGGILVVGAALHGNATIEDAYRSLWPVAGAFGAIVFGAALLAAGVASAATATYAGDVIFRALAPWRLPAMCRRALTIGPAALALAYGVPAMPLLIWSQVFLAFALPFAVVPLLLLVTEDHHRRPTLTGGLFLGASALAGAASIVLGAASMVQGFFQ